ncbi:SMI1/KNR4 family protein [Nitrospirillum bahiense]|uniref:SMI1/KNR4 family protein SUKH-1 n=1 Tax=Nitrospirillum amazonense TaxID=28077 RepID=A0A560FQT7_9PROT|nr:SMI1/KNR4 family protein [Nitrospirillum amazonense]TWB23968.1 SMI1/KNR4 family protein SUKH-1 [Nitrospirillum amazonense]
MDIKRLNINFGGTPSPGYQGGDAAINDVAALVHSALPSSYINFIKEADGGHPEIGSFAPVGGDAGNLFDIDLFYSFGDSRGTNIKAALARWGSILGQNALPIGRDGGGNQIYIDLTNGGQSVWIFLHDEENHRLKIANDFEAFIGLLQENPDFI